MGLGIEDFFDDENQIEVVKVYDHEHEAYVRIGVRVPAARIVVDICGESIPRVVDLLGHFSSKWIRVDVDMEHVRDGSYLSKASLLLDSPNPSWMFKICSLKVDMM